jgi:hypothetical protein
MKKIIFTLLLLTSFIYANAQSPCTPDTTIHHSGISKLKDGISNTPYNETLQFRFPSDTTVPGFGTIHIDSVKIFAVTGMPHGFTYQCNKKTSTYKGGENGCVQIKGNPVDSQIKSYTLVVNDTAWVKVSGFPAVITQPGNLPAGSVTFKITHNTGIFYQSVSDNFSVAQNFPNPFSTSAEIQVTSEKNQPMIFKVENEMGQQVYIKRVRAIIGQNTIYFERNNLPSGVYFFTVEAGQNTITRKMVIKD